MSWTLSGAVKNHEMPTLLTDKGETVSDSACKFILLMYADAANDDGIGAYPGIRALVKMTQLSTETVSNGVNALRHNEYLIPDGKSEFGTNAYRLNLIKLGVLVTRTRRSNDQNGGTLVTRTNPLTGRGGTIYDLYEQEIGVLTPLISEGLADAVIFYSEKWVRDAIKEASDQNKRNWKYCLAILKRWREQGNQDPAKGAPGRYPGKRRDKSTPPPAAAEPDWQKEMRKRLEAQGAI